MNRKHIIVICGVFLPEPSPTGLCAKRFIELIDDNYDIDIICISSYGTNIVTKDELKHTVYMLSGYRQGKEYCDRGFRKKIWHQLGRLEIKTFLLGNLDWYALAVYECLKKIHSKKKIDTIFSICSPFAAHVGAYKFKKEKNEVKWCAYTVDPYSTSNRIRPFWCSLTRLVNYEERILGYVDYLLLSDEVYRNRPEFIKDKNNTDSLPYILPEFKHENYGISYFDSEGINCVYAGRFYEDIRNPELMLQTFLGMKDSNIKLHLFSTGCESIVQKYASQTDKIVLHKLVPNDQIGSVYGESDVLILIANTTDEFLPSKTFEYIATGKPIVCFNCNKTCFKVLESYPLKYYVDEVTDKKAVEQFIVNSKSVLVDKTVIEKAYTRHIKSSVKAQLLKALS